MDINYVFFTKDLETGVFRIDRQHRNIIELYNRFVMSANDTDNTTPQLNDILDSLLKYIKLHFSDEEELLILMQYSRYEEHKREHDLIVTEMTKYCTMMLKGSLDNTTFASFFSHWIIKHIKESDGCFIREYRDNKM